MSVEYDGRDGRGPSESDYGVRNTIKESEQEGGITGQLRRAMDAGQRLDEVLEVLNKRLGPVLIRELEGSDQKSETDSGGARSGIAEQVEFLANRLERQVRRVRDLIEKVDI